MDQQLHEAIQRTLVLEPCHVTGMHDPTHTTTYMCNLQKAGLLDALMAAAGLAYDDLRRALHGPGCRSCHHVSSEEYERVKDRQLYAWAGVDLPEELATPGHAAPLPGDKEAILAELGKPHDQVSYHVNREGFRAIGDVVRAAARTVAGRETDVETRMYTAMRLMIDDREVDSFTHGGYARLPQNTSD